MIQKSAPSLDTIAVQAMNDKGFIPFFPDDVQNQVDSIKGPATPVQTPLLKDQRDFLWVSIDNDDSKDLDQISYAVGNTVYVAVADVDALIKKQTPVDKYAAHNTTSVYTPTKIFPMLPPRLSTDLTSLNQDEDRCAIVIEMQVGSDGKYTLTGIYPAWVRNKAKLAYHQVSDWLEKGFPDDQQHLKDQVVLQDQLAQKIKQYRLNVGTLTFDTIELQAQVINGQVVSIEELIHYRADEIIENLMIASNVSVSTYLKNNNLPTLKRIVKTPKNWDRIVQLAKQSGTNLPSEPSFIELAHFLNDQKQKNTQNFPDLSLAIIKLIGRGEYFAAFPGEDAPGHFDLGLIDYSHTTAPNRRFPDLVVQRLLKSSLYKTPAPYTKTELVGIAAQCTQKEDDATKVERRLKKSATALVLSTKIGQEYNAMVTGASSKGTWVRIDNPPVEGKLVQGFQNLGVGDRLRVKLTHTDVVNGFIDFVKI